MILPISGTSASSGFERTRFRDFTTGLGGPIRRDRAWFYGAYQHLRDYDSQPGTDPEFPRKYQQDKVFGKLTWQLTPKLRLVNSFHDEFWVNPQAPTLVSPFETTQRQHAHVPTMTFGYLTHTLSDNAYWDLRVGRYAYSRNDDPSSGNWTTPNRFDSLTRVNQGAPQQIGGLTIHRTTAKATLSHYRSGWLGTTHVLKTGMEVEVGDHTQQQIIPTGIRFVDNNGQPFQTISRDPAIAGGQSIAASLFITDSIRMGDRLTINAGVRFDHSRAISPDLRAIDFQGQQTENIIRGLGTQYTWNVVSPRLGLTAKLTSDDRTVLKANFGRFHQGVLTGEVSQNYPGLTPITTMAFEAATGGYTRLVSVVDPKINLLMDPHTRSPKTDVYSIGADRDFGRLSVGVAYVHKNGSDYISWTDVGGQYREETRTKPDGRVVPVFALVNATADRRFLVTNPDGYSLKYDGVIVSAEMRSSRGWMASTSYTYSRAYGLQSSSGATAGGAQLSTVANATPITFGQDPNDLTFARGRLANDRPHIFRATGSANMPWTKVSLAANLQHFSGKPWAATTLIVLPQGERRILLEPRGSRRLSSQSILDVRVSRPILSGEWGRIEVLLDVFNVFNDIAEEDLAADDLYSPNFGRPTIYADPRRAIAGVKLHLGRK